MAKYVDFLYEDEVTGEQFLVELKVEGKDIKQLKYEANIIARDNFDRPKYISIVDPEYAEMLGLDTY